MKFVQLSDRKLSANEQVTGEAHLERIFSAQRDRGVQLAVVNFQNGSITHWHDHPGEQILYVVEGQCRFGNKEGENIIANPGDAIYIPPGEVHWHRAVNGQNMSHISVTNVGPPNWMEPVTNDEANI